MSSGRLGIQPARALLRDTIDATAERVGTTPAALRQNLLGRNVAPAEVKLRLAELLGRKPERIWTPAMLAETYVGPRH